MAALCVTNETVQGVGVPKPTVTQVIDAGDSGVGRTGAVGVGEICPSNLFCYLGAPD